ncbi:hypothetical protein CJ030_MR3G012362 [Morella rubra]|uniref:Uncharacterized protein n=1 Tax=Morella rubra TaxID=262757 RepID=A0A6A1W5G5_9ROSI|nr:hypothetical protein CJ030_MR3G012362 [Morella rubra]
MGIARAPCLVRGTGALSLCARTLMPWHGYGALAARVVGMSRAPMGATNASSRHLSSHAWLSWPMSSLRTFSWWSQWPQQRHRMAYRPVVAAAISGYTSAPSPIATLGHEVAG